MKTAELDDGGGEMEEGKDLLELGVVVVRVGKGAEVLDDGGSVAGVEDGAIGGW